MALLAPLFVFIGAIWLLRLLLDALGAPLELVKLFSVTVASAISVLLSAVMIHTRGFGGFLQVVICATILALFSQTLITLSIIFAVVTGIPNIFVAPEFSLPIDPHHIRHIIGHMSFSIGAEVLLGSAMGSFLLWVLRIIIPQRRSDRTHH
ncbi:MAG: hypothetical protein QW828_08310 [Candidatus Bathyarchaeia archaeon]